MRVVAPERPSTFLRTTPDNLRGVRVDDAVDARRVCAVVLDREAVTFTACAIVARATVKGGLVLFESASTRPTLVLCDLQRASWRVLRQRGREDFFYHPLSFS